MVLLIKLSKDVRETRRTKFLLRYIELTGLLVAGRKQLRVEGGFKVLSKFLVRKINFPESRHCFIDSKKYEIFKKFKIFSQFAITKIRSTSNPTRKQPWFVSRKQSSHSLQFPIQQIRKFLNSERFQAASLDSQDCKAGAVVHQANDLLSWNFAD